MKRKITVGTIEWNLDGEMSFFFSFSFPFLFLFFSFRRQVTFFFSEKERNESVNVDIRRSTYIFEDGIGSRDQNPLLNGLSL